MSTASTFPNQVQLHSSQRTLTANAARVRNAVNLNRVRRVQVAFDRRWLAMIAHINHHHIETDAVPKRPGAIRTPAADISNVPRPKLRLLKAGIAGRASKLLLLFEMVSSP